MNSENPESPIVLSVCLISYNHEAFIRESLEGIIKQKTNFRFELVIGEDFSTDNTRKICEEYQQKYPDVIKLLPSDKNHGIVGNFHRTLNACQGKYIATCEGDDYWNDPLKLQKQVDFLEKNQDYVACFHNVKVIDVVGNVLRESKGKMGLRDLSADELMKGRVMSLLSLCYRNVIKEYPPEMLNVLAADKFLCSILGQHGSGKFLPEVEPAAYRLHAGGVWSLKNDRQKKMSLIVSYYWMWQYYKRLKHEEYATHFFNMIMREGFFSNPFHTSQTTWFDKMEFLIIRVLRKLFAFLRRLLGIK